MRITGILFFCLISVFTKAQHFEIAGKITLLRKPVEGGTIILENLAKTTKSNALGEFVFKDLPAGKYTVAISFIGAREFKKTIEITDRNAQIAIKLETENAIQLDAVDITRINDKVADKLNQVEGTAI